MIKNVNKSTPATIKAIKGEKIYMPPLINAKSKQIIAHLVRQTFFAFLDNFRSISYSQ